MTSSERGRLGVVIYRYATTDVVRVLVSGEPAAGRPADLLDREDLVGRLAARTVLLRARGHRPGRRHLQVPAPLPAGTVIRGVPPRAENNSR